MRKPGEWMQLPLDERILELLSEEPAMQPKAIKRAFEDRTASVRYHSKPIGSRCRCLTKMGFLTRTGAGVYSITDNGQAYLDGDMDAGKLDTTPIDDDPNC